MEKAFEFFDPWVKSQQDFLENWLIPVILCVKYGIFDGHRTS